MNWFWIIVVSLLAGLILGPLGRLLAPGEQKIGLLLTILVGAGAALLGGILATALGVGATPGIDWIRHGIQVVLAVVGVMAVASMGSGDSRTRVD